MDLWPPCRLGAERGFLARLPRGSGELHQARALGPELLGQFVVVRELRRLLRLELVEVEAGLALDLAARGELRIDFAAFSGVIMISFFASQIIGCIQSGAQSQIPVATAPGCTAFTVTPLPSSRFASARVNSTLPSLLRRYAFAIPQPPRSKPRSTRSIVAS